MDTFVLQGIQEMRFIRLPYAARTPEEYPSAYDKDGETVLLYNSHTDSCIQNGYERRSLVDMLNCWSSATTFDPFTKSADIAGICPWHYNHFSCDGMKGGGRHNGKIDRCRCKVGFELMNGHSYAPHVNKCHILHLHHMKYRLQSGKQFHRQDKGNPREQSPLATFLEHAIGNALH